MEIRTIKHIVTAICCIVLSQSAYSADELYNSELSGLAYINIPFGSSNGHSSPMFGFAFTRTPTTNITPGSANDLNSLLSNSNKKALFDIQYDLVERHWSRFAFGGINALVYDDVLHANGGGPVIDPALVVIGIGIAGVIVFSVVDDDDDPPPPPSNGENGENGDNGQPPLVFSDIRLKRDIANLVTLENGIKLYSFRYLWDDTVYVGVMAQDLLAHDPYRDAVTMTKAGFYVVHYEMLGLRMITLNEWNLKQHSIYTN